MVAATAEPDNQVAPLRERLISDAGRTIASEPLPPVHRLPFELLAEIMVIALAPCVGPYGGERAATAKEVLVLCRVCSYWRAVALNTARLWLATPLPIMAPGSAWKIAPAPTQLFSDRSSPLPIFVRIFPFSTREKTAELPAMVASLSHRWNTFQVICQYEEFDPTSLARISSGRLDNLETLRLYWTEPETWNGSELDVFLSAPRLRDVSLRVPLATSNVLSMPWAQLTRLSLTYDSPQLCFDALAMCTNLWTESELSDESHVARSTLLAHLVELKLHSRIWATGAHLGPFLRRFKLPALETLDLSLELCRSVDPDDHLIPWLAPYLTFSLRELPSVQCLRLGYCVEVEDVPDILYHVPNLTELELTDTDVDDAFFTALRYYGPDTTPLVPKLENLLLVDVGEYFEEESFGQMVRSRWWSDEERLAMPSPPAVTRLRHIQYWNEDWEYVTEGFVGFTPEFQKTLKEYCSQGLNSTGSNYF
ncbi:hypothetical protein C8R46DRAFT_1229825 [Mycena filopes]|nr:hypothetical protein C8R46DRAFT_1229825 [Mycena filopes]